MGIFTGESNKLLRLTCFAAWTSRKIDRKIDMYCKPKLVITLTKVHVSAVTFDCDEYKAKRSAKLSKKK